MAITAKVTSKGQITIPLQVRKLLKVDPGSVIIFETEEDKVPLKPVKTLSEFRGILKGKATHVDSDKTRAVAKKHVAEKVRNDER